MARIDSDEPVSGVPLGHAAVSLPREPKQERSRRKQERLIDAAEWLFAERGFEAVTADDIAARAGYPPGTFYNYFANKAQALVLVAARHEQAVAPTLRPLGEALAAGADIGDALRATLRGIYASKAAVPWLRRAWNRLVLSVPEVAAFQRGVDEAWESEIRELLSLLSAHGRLSVGDPATLAAVVRVLVDSVSDQAVVHGHPDGHAAVDVVADLLLALLGGEETR